MLRCIETHRLVADAFMNIEDNYPSELEPYWHTFPFELKKILRTYFSIDHIDDNRLNSHVSNLRFVSARTNNTYIKAKEFE